MDARTTPFTRMTALAAAYRVERDMFEALERDTAAGRRVSARLLRAIGHEPAASATCCGAAPRFPSLL